MSKSIDLLITPPHREDYIGSFSSEEIHLFRNGKKRGNVEIEISGGETSTKWLPDSEIGTSSFFIESVIKQTNLVLKLWCTKEAGRLVRIRDIVTADGIQFRIIRAVDENHFEAYTILDDLRIRARVLQIVDARETERERRRSPAARRANSPPVRREAFSTNGVPDVMDNSPLAPLISVVANSGAALTQLGLAAAKLQETLEKMARDAAADAATEAILALTKGAHVIAFCGGEKCGRDTLHSVGETKADGKFRLICNVCFSGRLEEELRVVALIHQTGELAERQHKNLERRDRLEYYDRENDYLPRTKEERNRQWLRARSNLVRERKGSFHGGRVRARSNLRRR